ncbi:MAG TPA: MEMO1 family protein [Candidatus Nitrosopolaris rasttigaisensis]|nr:MEMO1 family protein [Candidatus Nitrosopolaris rasttigaisensis]
MIRGNRRAPAVAGLFYPSGADELNQLIELSFKERRFGPGDLPPSKELRRRRIYGIVSPHAGYIYSGAVAANGYYETSSMNFDRVVMIGPNHYGIGTGLATVRDGIWETPLGQVEIDTELASRISESSGILDFDDLAHSRDHCLEVQLPFLQYIKKNQFKVVPIIMIIQDKGTASEIGESIADSTRTLNALLIASSDFTHYEPNSAAHRKDRELIEAILSLDTSIFYTTLERLNVSACGYGAIASIMTAAKALGATKGELLRYATSGDIVGDTNNVVGYASIIFT